LGAFQTFFRLFELAFLEVHAREQQVRFEKLLVLFQYLRD